MSQFYNIWQPHEPEPIEFEGKLYITYSVNKEDCDLSILSLEDIALL